MTPHTYTEPAVNQVASKKEALARRQQIWRWHFFAGLTIAPFAIVLAITGAIYLFKPQIQQWQEYQANQNSPYQAQPENISAEVSIIAEHLPQILAAYPGATWRDMTLPKSPQDPSFELTLNVQQRRLLLWIDVTTGAVLKELWHDQQVTHIAMLLHGELLLGNIGGYWVELMASWMLLLLVSGVYLWWPKSQDSQSKSQVANDKSLAASRTSGPRWQHWWQQLRLPKPQQKWHGAALRQLHGATGLWTAPLLIVFLLTGLPWTQLWGGAYERIETFMGWHQPIPSSSDVYFPQQLSSAPVTSNPLMSTQDNPHLATTWRKSSNEEREVDSAQSHYPFSLRLLLTNINNITLPSPITIRAPSGNGQWTIVGGHSNPLTRTSVSYSGTTGALTGQHQLHNNHPMRSLISLSIALHAGRLFGIANQILGLLAALAVIAMSIAGVMMWWKRKPKGKLAAPKAAKVDKVLMVILLLGAVFLPTVAISLLVVISLWLMTKQYQKINA